jgi:hypothetical protein
MINETILFKAIGESAAKSTIEKKAELIELFASYLAGNGSDKDPTGLLNLALKRAKSISKF